MRRNHPLISVIVPIYNAYSYINDTIKSILNQTYSNLEIILIDDGSVDGSSDLCDEWCAIDERVICYHIPNSGVSCARNYGIDHACGEYVTFVDADDYIDPNMYELMIDKMIFYNVKICCSSHQRNIAGVNNIEFQRSKIEVVESESAFEEMCRLYSRDKRFGWEVWDKIFKRDILEGIRFHIDIKIGEDLLFLWEVLQKNEDMLYLPLHMYHYCSNNGSAMNDMNFKKRKIELNAMRKIYLETNKNKKIKELLKGHYFIALIATLKQFNSIKTVSEYNDFLEIRNGMIENFFSILTYSNLRCRTKLGAILFLLPIHMFFLLRWK